MSGSESKQWYQVVRLLPDLWAIKDLRSSEHAICYLLCGSKKALLFDANIGVASLKKVVSTLTALPVVVVLSHWHFDHVGGAHEFSEAWAWNSPYMLAASESGISAELVRKYGGESFLKSIGQPGWEVRPFKGVHLLAPDQIIDLGNYKLQVLHTPGHTPDSVCLHEPERQWLFAGDTVYPGELYMQFPESDMAAYKNSIKTLGSLPLRYVFPGHTSAQTQGDLLVEIKKLLGNASYRSKKYPQLQLIEMEH